MSDNGTRSDSSGRLPIMGIEDEEFAKTLPVAEDCIEDMEDADADG